MRTPYGECKRLADHRQGAQSVNKGWDRAVQEHADSLAFSFEAPLKEYVRMVKSAKAVMADRGLALGTLQSARSDVDAKRTKLAKLRGTPGIKVRPSLFIHSEYSANRPPASPA